MDDVRYAMTLEAALAKAGLSPAAKGVRAAYDKWRKSLQGASPSPSQIVGHRDRLIDWLLTLRQ